MRQRGAAADPNEVEADRKMYAHFLSKGFTDGQAKIKAVLQDERISTVCSSMSSTAILMANVAAALDKTKLAADDIDVLKSYAQQTCSGYCAGCGNLCEQATAGVPVSDVMRALMYHNSYGDKALAKEVFAEIPAGTRKRLLSVDYGVAEVRCPNRMPIARLMADAVARLG
jgi:predicted aldo/keto reductase-like oxidoreductase